MLLFAGNVLSQIGVFKPSPFMQVCYGKNKIKLQDPRLQRPFRLSGARNPQPPASRQLLLAECRCRGQLLEPSCTWSLTHFAGILPVSQNHSPTVSFMPSQGAKLAEFSTTVFCRAFHYRVYPRSRQPSYSPPSDQREYAT